MRIAEVNGTNIHYKDTDVDNAPTIVFSNSLGSDLRIWDRLCHYLEKKYRIIRYDSRGHGLSDISNTPYSIKLLADDLASLLEFLKIDNAIICGISVGGLVAQQLATTHPQIVNGLVLCNTAPKIGNEELWIDRIKKVKSNGINAQADIIIDRWFSSKFKSEKKTEIAGWSNMLTRTTVDGYISTCEAIKNADLHAGTEQITVPTLCIAGNEDIVTSPKDVQDMAMMMNDATFKRIDDAGHLPPIEKPEILAFHINEFVKENDLK